MADILNYRFVDIDEATRDLAGLLEQSQGEGTDIVITHKGKPTALLVDVEKYLEMREALRELSDHHYAQELLEAHKQVQEGKGIPSEEVFREKGL
jgi:prevent-host-death family protein